MICYQLGVALIVFSALFYCYDVRKLDKQKVSYMVLISISPAALLSLFTFYTTC